ncbi:YjgN family protein [Pseudomonas saliphila]|uniref:YjgN family protein n=1 Tax=Pseudomonas saliphila TaxID=2586906 RepID=UPI0015B760BB|nr:YjgN family protein [Pseudomonas saliphila]
MSSELFKVCFNGRLVEGQAEDQLRWNLQKSGFRPEQIETLLAGKSATIKRGLDSEQAQAYQRRLHAAGLVVDIVPEAVRPDSNQPRVESPASGNSGLSLVSLEASASERSGSDAPVNPQPPISELKPATPRRSEPVVFTGRGGEFFGIWIVNLLLMVVTLGFYAPWAKVRTLQYFYGHTQIDGSSFQYLADPWVIFRGRLIALVAVIVWIVVSKLLPIGSLVLLLLFIPALPWVVMRSLQFHAVNSAYRNIRFDFKGSYGGACMAILLWPLVAVLTLLLAAPYSLFKSHSYVVNNSLFGTMPFRLKLQAADYYVFFLRVIAVGIGCVILAVVLGKLVHPALVFPVGVIGYLALFGYFMAGLTNLVMNATLLGMHGFESQLGKRRMVWIFLSNSLLIMLTLGFFTPWAKVRMAAYRASCTSVEIQGDLDGFIAGEARRSSAIGQEIGEAFDVGISII